MRSLTKSATLSSRCSQLSTTSSARFAASVATTDSATVLSGCSTTSSAFAKVAGSNEGSRSGASPTQYTPSGKDPATAAAACTTRRVFPVPPVPVRVRRRRSGRPRSSTTEASSCSRPRNGVAGTGRFERYKLFNGGKATSPSWKTTLGRTQVIEAMLATERYVVSPASTSAAVAADTSTCPPCPAAATRAARCTS